MYSFHEHGLVPRFVFFILANRRGSVKPVNLVMTYFKRETLKIQVEECIRLLLIVRMLIMKMESQVSEMIWRNDER